MVAELTANHSAYYIDDSIAPAPALLANGWNDDLFPVDESVRYYNKVRAKHPNAPISMFHLDFGHSPRAGVGLRRRPRGADGGRERVAGLLRQGRRVRAGRRARRRRHPHLEVPGQQRRHALPRADVGAARARRDPDRRRRGADDRRSRHAAVERVHVRRRLHDHRRAPTTPRPRPTSVPAADDGVHARGLADDHRQARRHGRQRHGRGAAVRRRRRHAAADRARRAAPARRRRRPDGAGLPAAPAGLDRPARPRAQARAAGAGLAVPAHADGPAVGRRSATCSCGCRSSTRRARTSGGLTVAAPGGEVVPAGYKLAREYATEATGGVGGTVPATLSLTMGAAGERSARSSRASAREYTASTTATVISTRGRRDADGHRSEQRSRPAAWSTGRSRSRSRCWSRAQRSRRR